LESFGEEGSRFKLLKPVFHSRLAFLNPPWQNHGMNLSRLRSRLCAATSLLGLTLAGYCADTKVEPRPLEGQTFVHDPSTVVNEDGTYYVFSTGRGVLSKSSRDLVHWTDGPSVFGQMPGWSLSAVPGFRGCWAPDVIRLNGQFYLYYAVSTFGKQVSAIGLATNPTLDSSSTDYHWTDRGPVIQSTNGSAFNTIDPSVMSDTDGKLWMAFGSFWKGIYLIQLDPKTGLRADTHSAPQRLAWNSKIEAACLTRHDEFYYLFVNWGQCCRGTNSTYEVHVGRAKNITGPYLDRDGMDLVDEGGTLFLETTGRFIGPGHIGILTDGGTNWFSYHYYDADTYGRSRLALGQIHWSDDGWPAVQKIVQAK
jgi:arabinan endo-1,5-alpha-L-arabinosidase